MKPQQPQSTHRQVLDTTPLVQDAENQAGEDNVYPWLLIHNTLIQAAVSGCKYGLKTAVERAHKQRN